MPDREPRELAAELRKDGKEFGNTLYPEAADTLGSLQEENERLGAIDPRRLSALLHYLSTWSVPPEQRAYLAEVKDVLASRQEAS